MMYLSEMKLLTNFLSTPQALNTCQTILTIYCVIYRHCSALYIITTIPLAPSTMEVQMLLMPTPAVSRQLAEDAEWEEFQQFS